MKSILVRFSIIFFNFAAVMEKQKVIISTKLETTVTTAVGECERDRIFILVDETTRQLCLPLIDSPSRLRSLPKSGMRRNGRTRRARMAIRVSTTWQR